MAHRNHLSLERAGSHHVARSPWSDLVVAGGDERELRPEDRNRDEDQRPKIGPTSPRAAPTTMAATKPTNATAMTSFFQMIVHGAG
ncbi:hypothetical protein [Natrinema soli]|uniref:Uncharacterized protein n=1 Tax=Natrinema soli TaxID=1930624 RepID=A0ABD5SVD5_9EURY|nr:hypothetical protein [Natrinema soli]